MPPNIIPVPSLEAFFEQGKKLWPDIYVLGCWDEKPWKPPLMHKPSVLHWFSCVGSGSAMWEEALVYSLGEPEV